MGNIRGYLSTIVDVTTNALVGLFNAQEGQQAKTVNNSMRQYAADVKGFAEELPWFDRGHTPTRTGNATFTIPTDVTAIYTNDRRLKLGDATTLYASIVSSSFGAGVTTVTVETDDGSNLSASLATVHYAVEDPANASAPASFGRKDYALTTGTASAYVASFTPKIPSLTNGVRCRIRLHTTCDATPTFAPDSLTAKTIVKPGNVAVADDELTADSILPLVYVAALDKWVVEGAPSGTELSADTTPQLGGDLDANSHKILMGDYAIERALLKDYAETLNAIGNTSTACTIDLETGNAFSATLNGNCTFTFSNPPASGRHGSFILYLLNDGTPGRTVTWPAAVKWSAGSAPSRSTDASDMNIYAFFTKDAGTTWYGNLIVRDPS